MAAGNPRVINVDKDKAYFSNAREGRFESTELRRVKYLNNRIEKLTKQVTTKNLHQKGILLKGSKQCTGFSKGKLIESRTETPMI